MSAPWTRDGAPETDGLHVQGDDGEYSEHVRSDHPRCLECQALLVGAEDDGLCTGCRKTYEQAEEAARRRAERRERLEGASS